MTTSCPTLMALAKERADLKMWVKRNEAYAEEYLSTRGSAGGNGRLGEGEDAYGNAKRRGSGLKRRGIGFHGQCGSKNRRGRRNGKRRRKMKVEEASVEDHVVEIRGVFDPASAAREDGFIEHLQLDFMEECVKFGPLKSLHVNAKDGSVIVTFESRTCAEVCAGVMDERPFDGRVMNACLVRAANVQATPVQTTEAEETKSISATDERTAPDVIGRPSSVVHICNVFDPVTAARESGFVEQLQLDFMAECVNFGPMKTLEICAEKGSVRVVFESPSSAEICAKTMDKRPFDGRIMSASCAEVEERTDRDAESNAPESNAPKETKKSKRRSRWDMQ